MKPFQQSTLEYFLRVVHYEDLFKPIPPSVHNLQPTAFRELVFAQRALTNLQSTFNRFAFDLEVHKVQKGALSGKYILRFDSSCNHCYDRLDRLWVLINIEEYNYLFRYKDHVGNVQDHIRPKSLYETKPPPAKPKSLFKKRKLIPKLKNVSTSKI